MSQCFQQKRNINTFDALRFIEILEDKKTRVRTGKKRSCQMIM